MIQLELKKIRTDGGTQTREKLNQDTVQAYAEHMREGDVFPSIIVYHDGSEYWLASGFHRYFAAKSNASLTIGTEVRVGTLKEAKMFSYKANEGNKRGLSMTDADNRQIIIKMLQDPDLKEWSNKQIADWVGVSKMTVGRVKNSLEEKEDKPKDTKYVDKHGNTTTMDTTNIGKKKDKPKEIDKKDELIVNLTEQVGELSDTIVLQSKENDLLRDKIAIGQWDASDIEKIDAEETIAALREQIRLLEIENKSMREGRDMYQNRNAELMKTVKSLQIKLRKLEG